jgi:pimeloyl-ACP methyl ester carboxylesterase
MKRTSPPDRLSIPTLPFRSIFVVCLALGVAACRTGTEVPPPRDEARTYQPEVGVKTITAGEVELAYFESGSGELVILLHGFPDTPRTWDDLRPRLVAAGYRTVAPFLRGYAPSTIPAGDEYRVPQLGGDVVALIDALGADRAVLIGHDWGASAAYAAANLAPDRVARLVTLAIAHPLAFVKHPDALQSSPHFAELVQPGAVEAFARDDFRGVDRLYARWSPSWDVPEAELEPVKNAFTAEGCLNGALGYYRAFAGQAPDPVLFQKTGVRTLTFWGRTDGAGDQSVFADHADGFTGPVELVEIDAGHFLHREAPAEVGQRIVEFLAAP